MSKRPFAKSEIGTQHAAPIPTGGKTVIAVTAKHDPVAKILNEPRIGFNAIRKAKKAAR